MNHEKVFLFELDGSAVLGFDTGLNSRAFAQAKFAQVITEPGLIVRQDGRHQGGDTELWKAIGVVEYTRDGAPTMVVWGPSFNGEHLDLLLEEAAQDTDKALEAISVWIQGVLAVKKEPQCILSLWPGAALIGKDAVFFMPPSLARRCVLGDGFSSGEWYVHPDLDGEANSIVGAAFTAAAMLYRVFAGVPPFPAADELVLHQDMRDGNFLPVRFAVPGLDKRFAGLIQNALAQPGKNDGSAGGSLRPVPSKTAQAQAQTVLGEFLAILQTKEPLVQPLPEAERLALEKEKNQYHKIQTASVKTRRFIARNTAILLGSLAGIVLAAIIAHSVITTRAGLPTTAGMDPIEVIESYYDSFGALDHQMMEACVIKSAGKDDISTVLNFYVISKVRQAYEANISPATIPAKEWQDSGGGPSEMPVFGVTDLRIELLAVSDETVHCRTDYILWVPAQASTEATEEAIEELLPWPYPRSDMITLIPKKGNWRISEITRENKW